MKSKLFVFIFIVILFGSLYSSIKFFQSVGIQTFLMYDFNNETYNTPYEIYAEKLNDNYPNITLTSLPIKMMKARYYMNNDSIAKAKSLLFSAIKANPYVKGPELLLADIYFNEKKYDSSLHFAKDAFYNLSNVNSHRSIYFRALRHFKDSTELDKAFNLIKHYNNPTHWYDYFTSRYSIVGKDDKKLINEIQNFKVKFPNENQTQIKEIETFVSIGSEQFSLSYLIANEGEKEFVNGDYLRSAELYETSILLNNNEYIFYENAAIAYGALKELDKAIKYYDEVIYRLGSEDGKSEYMKGLLKIQLSNKEKGCNYLSISSQKKYIDTSTGIKAIDLFNRFCN